MDLSLDVSDPVDRTLYLVLSGEITRAADIVNRVSDMEGIHSVDIGYPILGIQIRSMTIDGFGPHDGPNDIYLDTGPSLLEGPNGSGKSHIIYALNWCLFGRTGNMDPWSADSGGSKDLINWNRKFEDGMSVKVVLKVNDGRLEIERGYNKDGQYFRIKDRTGRELDEHSIPLDRVTSPFILYQGETAMFLSMEDPVSNKGIIGSLLHSLVGGDALDQARHILEEGKDVMMKKIGSSTEKTDRAEGRLEGIRKRIDRIAKDIDHSEKHIRDLSNRKEETGKRYRAVMKGLVDGTDADHGKKKRTIAATRAGRLEEKLEIAWSRSPIEMLRPLAEKALDRAREKKEGSNGRRLLFGAMEAQIAIVNEVMERKSCICGTSIARTGMGKERLEHLLSNLEERKRDASRWDTETIWSSDQFISKVAKDLSSDGEGGEDIISMVRELKKFRGAMDQSSGTIGPDDARDRIIEAVKEHERVKVLLQEEKKRIRTLLSEKDDLKMESNSLEKMLISKYGTSGGKEEIVSMIPAIESSISRIERIREDRIERMRSSLEDEATRALGRIIGDQKRGVKVHPEGMRVGRSENGGRVIPLDRLSTGEREAVVLAIMIGLSELTGSSIILDSPFSNMERGSVIGAMDLISNLKRPVLVMTPSGSIPDEKIYSGTRSGPRMTRYRLVPGDPGSMIKEAED